MTIPEPFTFVALSAGILTNVATDILIHHTQALENTLVGKMLKWTGFIEPNFDDRMWDTVRKALGLYLETYPEYKLSGVMAFFRDSSVAGQIGSYKIKQRIPFLDQTRWEQILESKKLLAKECGVSPELIVDLFNRIHKEALRLENELLEDHA